MTSPTPACRARARNRATSSSEATSYGRLAVPVEQLLEQQVDVVVAADLGQPLVHLQPQPLARDVVVRQVGVDGQLDADLVELGLRRRPRNSCTASPTSRT